mgnify:CR=1 FL=1
MLSGGQAVQVVMYTAAATIDTVQPSCMDSHVRRYGRADRLTLVRALPRDQVQLQEDETPHQQGDNERRNSATLLGST